MKVVNGTKKPWKKKNSSAVVTRVEGTLGRDLRSLLGERWEKLGETRPETLGSATIFKKSF